MVDHQDKDPENPLPRNIEILSKQLETLAKNAPSGGYLRVIKKKYFKKKTNWSMLSVLIGLAALLVAALKLYL